MSDKRRLHDGIVGLIITAGVALGYWVAPVWLPVPGIVGVLMIPSWVTGFCPVYYTLEKLGVGEGSQTPAAGAPRG